MPITEKMYPILDGPHIPWRVIEPFGFQAKRNHSQTLERLAERGGLGVTEAIDVLMAQGYDTYKYVSKMQAVLDLQKIVAERLALLQPAESAELTQLREQNLALLKVYDAVANLVKVKGRHHTEQAYQNLVSVFDDVKEDRL